MRTAKEGFPFIIPSLAAGLLAYLASGILPAAGFLILAGYFIYFFRDPERLTPSAPDIIVSAADGVVAGIRDIPESGLTHLSDMRKQLNSPALFQNGAVCISVFLSLFDVHVNRAPVSGEVRFLQYYPGKRYFTFLEKSSRHNQHNAILIGRTGRLCLIHQIVGPVARRVVAWLKTGQEIKKGDRIGIMKFGSRLDLYFEKESIRIKAQAGERVRAGETVLATWNHFS